MNPQAFKELPTETLHDLLFEATKELLESFDAKDELKINSKKKQVALLLDLIEDRKHRKAPVYSGIKKI